MLFSVGKIKIQRGHMFFCLLLVHLSRLRLTSKGKCQGVFQQTGISYSKGKSIFLQEYAESCKNLWHNEVFML